MPNRRWVIDALEQTSNPRWEEFLLIYREAFPVWEREPEDIVAERVTHGRYKLKIGMLNGKVIGFYLLDINSDPRYVLFSFLAVDVRHRGHGWGTLFCQDAKTYFKTFVDSPWLFVEAQERQAVFYGRLGFFKLVLDYRVPRFDGAGVVPMHLMVFPNKPPPTSIPGADLNLILRSLFIHGYPLETDDQRITDQLVRVGNDVKLITWPEGNGVLQ